MKSPFESSKELLVQALEFLFLQEVSETIKFKLPTLELSQLHQFVNKLSEKMFSVMFGI